MKKKLTAYLALALAMASCGELPDFPDPDAPETSIEKGALVIEPIITKATDSDFEAGDMIGLTVTTDEGNYLENAPMTYGEGMFKGGLTWYLDQDKKSDLYAYYPYSEAGWPETFTVGEDQSEGTTKYDLMLGIKNGIVPSENTVSMVFKHQLTKVTLYLANLSGKDIEAVSLAGLNPTAVLGPEKGQVSAAAGTEPITIKTWNIRKDTVWQAIIVPQKASMQLQVSMSDGKVLKKSLAEIDLLQGNNYSVSAVVNTDLKIITYGQILPWLDGGDIPGLDDPEPEKPDQPDQPEPDENHIVYGGESYRIVTLKDGRTWMAENLRYVPEGKTVTPLAEKYTEGSTGIWYPAAFSIVNNAGVLTPSSDPAVIKAQGLLYSQEVLMNGTAMPETEFADASNIRGICPEGWHIPTAQEWIDLVGACSTSSKNNASAPYYNPDLNGADMEKLNADGFNYLPYPFLNNGTTYSGPYLNKDAERYLYGYCSMTYFASSTSHIGTKLQAYAAMITNNASKCSSNVAYSNLVNGVHVRCIKDK